MTHKEVAEQLDYVDDMDELEIQRQVALYDRGERYKKYATVVIMILSIVTAVVLIVEVMK